MVEFQCDENRKPNGHHYYSLPPSGGLSVFSFPSYLLFCSSLSSFLPLFLPSLISPFLPSSLSKQTHTIDINININIIILSILSYPILSYPIQSNPIQSNPILSANQYLPPPRSTVDSTYPHASTPSHPTSAHLISSYPSYPSHLLSSPSASPLLHLTHPSS